MADMNLISKGGISCVLYNDSGRFMGRLSVSGGHIMASLVNVSEDLTIDHLTDEISRALRDCYLVSPDEFKPTVGPE